MKMDYKISNVTSFCIKFCNPFNKEKVDAFISFLKQTKTICDMSLKQLADLFCSTRREKDIERRDHTLLTKINTDGDIAEGDSSPTETKETSSSLTETEPHLPHMTCLGSQRATPEEQFLQKYRYESKMQVSENHDVIPVCDFTDCDKQHSGDEIDALKDLLKRPLLVEKQNEFGQEKESSTDDSSDVDHDDLLRDLEVAQNFNIRLPDVILVYMQPERPLQKIGDIPWSSLREEKCRLVTFAKYSHNVAKSSILLAANGFAYIGSGRGHDDKVICYFCCQTKEGWCLEDDILEVHRGIFPECPMVTRTECDNESFCEQHGTVDLSQHFSAPNIPHELLSSSNSSPNQLAVTTNEIDPRNSRTTSASDSHQPCTSLPPATTAAMTLPHTNHTRDPPSSNQSSQVSPRAENLRYYDLPIVVGTRKRPEYDCKFKRLETFGPWSSKHHLKKEVFAEAGFCYDGKDDCVVCFCCGGALQKWETGDDPWVEHARWFPRCAFITQAMGQRFIDAVQDLKEQHDQIPFEIVCKKMGAHRWHFQTISNEWPKRDDPAVQALVDEGFQIDDVIEMARRVRAGGDSLSADKVLEALQENGKPKEPCGAAPHPRSTVSDAAVTEEDDEKEKIASLKDENNKLRQQIICNICRDKEVAIVFLYCGHLVSCINCASAVKECPVCGKNVEGTVRAFLT